MIGAAQELTNHASWMLKQLPQVQLVGLVLFATVEFKLKTH